MFFKTDVLSKKLEFYSTIKKFESGAITTWTHGTPYNFQHIVYKTIGPKGSIMYGFTIGEEHTEKTENRWVRIDYDTVTVHYMDSTSDYTKQFFLTSVLNYLEDLRTLGFSDSEIHLLDTLISNVRIRGSNVV